MEKKSILYSLIILLAVSCAVKEIDVQTPPSVVEEPVEEDVFYASLEFDYAPDTKVFVDGDIKMHWNAEDQLSIFNKNTLNHQYQFSGETGDIAGYFTSVSDPTGTGNDLDLIYAVHPYRESTTISDEGVLTLTLPSEQAYKENTFDPGANTMVSKTDGNFLKFKNACGYLVLKFRGAGVSISSIKLEGHNEEKLSGEATVSYIGGNPMITMAETAGTSITLTFKNPFVLGDDPTVFWMVVPPTRFMNGFRLTVTDPTGNVFIKETTKDLSITRNKLLRISPIEVTYDSSVISLTEDDISLVYPNTNSVHISPVTEADRIVTVTMPTVTNFHNLKFNFNVGNKEVLVNGEKIVNGETPIDASKDVTLTICDGQHGKNYTLKAQNTGLPVVRITTEGFTREDIESEPVHQTRWRPSNPDDQDPIAGSASIRIEWPDGTLDCETGLQIKGRGNATWGYPKRPYALKLADKKKLLKMGDKKHARWILLANWKDRTLLRNDAAFWLSRQSGLPYTVRGQFVELEINGDHRGNYYLCEQIKIDKGNRVNISKMPDLQTGAEEEEIAITGGYLMEIDNNWDDLNSFWSGKYPRDRSNPNNLKDIGGFNFKYQFKEPDEENRSNDAYYYMTKFIAELEEMIKKIPNGNTQYRTYFDTGSAIRFMIVNELTGNGDFYNENWSNEYKGPHSTYLYKDRDQLSEDGTTRIVSKLHMGPVWDFDYLTFTPDQSSRWVGASTRNYYFYYLCKDSAFHTEMENIWDNTKSDLSGLPAYIEQQRKYIKLSAEIDGKMWWNTEEHGNQHQDQNGELNMTFDEAVNSIKTCFTTKWNFIEANIKTLNK